MCKILKELEGKTPEYILNKYSSTSNISVDIVEIAKNIGIKLGSLDFTQLEKEDSFKDIVRQRGHILGAVYIDGDNLQIVYHNSLHNENANDNCLSDADKLTKLRYRQRFTIAHEIAHCCLHIKVGEKSHIEYRTEQSDYINTYEREANIFAGSLLIPTNKITLVCSLLGNNISISLLAELFKVSNNVMQARIDYLKNELGYFNDIKFS